MQALVLNDQQAPAFASLTYPHYRHLLEHFDPVRTLALGIEVQAQPAALLLVFHTPESKQTSMLSFFVRPAHRGQGLGRRLLQEIEPEARARGIKTLCGDYPSPRPTEAALTHLLQSQGYSAPELTNLLARASGQGILRAPWMHGRPLPKEYCLVPWGDVSDNEIDAFRTCEPEQQPILEEGLEPWPTVAHRPFDLDTSLGLRHRGRLIGWMLNHRAGSKRMLYERLFIEPEYRRLGQAVALLAASIARHIALDGLECSGVWQTRSTNRPMVAFIERRMTPYLDSLSRMYRVEKHLV